MHRSKRCAFFLYICFMLELLSKHHNEWIKMARSIGTNNPSDLVQDMYIRLYDYSNIEKITNNGKVNKMYVWLTLRNLYYSEYKKRINTTLIDEVKNLQDSSEKECYKIDEKIQDCIDSWGWYESKLFTIYKDDGKSMRTLAKETGISLSSINNTLKKCKRSLITEVGEDYKDYLNKDYELI